MKKHIILLLLFSLVFFFGTPAHSQCSMCRRIAESNMEAGESRGKGLNTGILYLMSVPYLMAGVVGYAFWKKRNKSGNKTEIR